MNSLRSLKAHYEPDRLAANLISVEEMSSLKTDSGIGAEHIRKIGRQFDIGAFGSRRLGPDLRPGTSSREISSP